MKIFLVYIPRIIILTFLINCSDNINPKLEQEMLMKTDQEFANTSLEKGAAEAFRLFLTEDAIQLPSGYYPVFGREIIYQNLKKTPSSYKLEWKPEKAEVAKSGDLGYTWGNYIASYRDEKENIKKSFGKYLNVWQKQNDGSWKVLIDMGNQNPEPKKN